MIVCDLKTLEESFLVIIIKIMNYCNSQFHYTVLQQKLMFDRYIICKAVDVFIHKNRWNLFVTQAFSRFLCLITC